MYIIGVAGSVKTEVILHIMQRLKGRVQACATTGIAAKNLNAPTLHGMLDLSQTDAIIVLCVLTVTAKNVKTIG